MAKGNDKNPSSVKDFLARLFGKADASQGNEYFHEIRGDGVLFAPRDKLGDPRTESELVLYQHALLQQLVEQGEAEQVPGGYFCPTESILQLSNDDALLLQLPARQNLRFDIKVNGTTSQLGFNVTATIVLPDGDRVPAPKPYGPIIDLGGGEEWLLSASQHVALKAIAEHGKLAPSDKGEDKNLELVALLQEAARNGVEMDLRHFDSIEVVRPGKPSVAVTRMSDGSLNLTPVFGAEISPDDIERRLHQVSGRLGSARSLRVKNKIVFMTEDRLEATRNILESKTIAPELVEDFLKTPSAFLDPDLVDLDTGFAVRVQGVTEFRHVPNAEWDSSGRDWFEEVARACSPEVLVSILKTDDDIDQFEKNVEQAWDSGAKEVVFNGDAVDVADKPKVKQAISEARAKVIEDGVSEDEDEDMPAKRATYKLNEIEANADSLRNLARKSIESANPEFSSYKRQPFPHQREGVEWMVGLSQSRFSEQLGQGNQITGALLADDMGLGKTFMALVGVDQYLRTCRQQGQIEKPVLVVAPLSLLENWSREVDETFIESPFDDVILLQSGKDLARFKLKGEGQETRQKIGDDEDDNLDRIRYALKVGSQHGRHKLDQPKRLVLVSYDTLRNYQFSLGRIDWSWVIFDEAQNVKNPNTLQSRAAAALKAEFKLMATGTPVENRLAEFWCIMDIAQPGLLGDWPTFRERFVNPAKEDAETAGRALRAAVGNFMLRRTKEESLEGIPPKHIHHGAVDANAPQTPLPGFSPGLRAPMSERQLTLYDQVLADLRVRRKNSQGGPAVLQALHKLRQVSLHPALAVDDGSRLSPEEWARQSGKVEALGGLLDQIRARGEKVLIFAIYKNLQRDLKVWLARRYGQDFNIINGDTKASGAGVGQTRLGIIDRFQSSPGFNVLVMSPIAAGVGLTITEANHVIHLERHWNPAKEAQATDRVYRIGQQKDVHVYLPISAHPSLKSFDDTLDALLRSKVQIKDAVVAPRPVTEQDMLDVM